MSVLNKKPDHNIHYPLMWKRLAWLAGILFIAMLAFCLLPTSPAQARAPQSNIDYNDFSLVETKLMSPNIIIIVADDMGYSDLGSFGSEIDTDSLDDLADDGMLFTNFHTLPAGSPTRAVLLTGVDNHENGLGTMPSNLRNTPNHQGPGHTTANPQGLDGGYESYLNEEVVTIASLLKNVPPTDSGYHTYMAGTWDLGDEEPYRPWERGFEYSYIFLEGGGSHYTNDPMLGSTQHYFETDPINGTTAFTPTNASGFYSTKNYTEWVIDTVGMSSSLDDRPFFVYLAYTAPHWPLQVPVYSDSARNPSGKDYVGRYLGDPQGGGTTQFNYNDATLGGWDAVRQARFTKMQDVLNIIPTGLALPPRWSTTGDPSGYDVPVWATLDYTDKVTHATDMAIYAGMIDYMDDSIGNLLDALKQYDHGSSPTKLEDTIVIFFSDNGPEPKDRDTTLPKFLFDDALDNSLENRGLYQSFVTYHPGWAQVSATPHYGAKTTNAEGGIRNAFIVARYDDIGTPVFSNTRTGAIATVHDLVPTLLDYAGIAHPAGRENAIQSQDNGEELCYSAPYTSTANDGSQCSPMHGRSLHDLWEGNVDHIYGDTDPIAFELYGTTNRALFMGDYKILKLHDEGTGYKWGWPGGGWRMFNLKEDPRELNDLSLSASATNAEIMAQMIEHYNNYEKSVGFVSAYDSVYLPLVVNSGLD